MNIFYHTNENKKINNPIITIGTFDGVHLGHKKLINRLNELATKFDGESTILTFHPHPRIVLANDYSIRLLSTIDEKKQLLEKAGIKNLIIHPFTKEFSELTSIEFIEQILLNSIKPKAIVIGYNHHFGKNREGSFEQLKSYSATHNFYIEEISAFDINEIEISSTRIRNALSIGDLKTANSYLGYTYSISGKVVEGKKLGRTIGYPTANIEAEDKTKLIPGDGIYAVHVKHKNVFYKGMLSIGMNPTVNGIHKTIEVHIFDFNFDIYGTNLVIYFFEKLRNEAKFAGLDELKNQLHLDKVNSLKVLERFDDLKN
ncbi:MAG: bifunctional riboflavin kinase/FAD synthetase [Bacteroidetes bacterium]|nr:bifunctional riboflavin kinase/FAD synthetase [Bacteroidota bacterium]